MGKRLGKQTIMFSNSAKIIGNYSIVGEKEGNGTFREYYDYVLKNDTFGEKTYESAERKLIEHSIANALDNAGVKSKDLDLLICGDLLNQIISSSFAARDFDLTFLGLYGACSTMAEALAVGATFIDGGYFNTIACATGSHFSTVERQYRFPLELGNQRPPVSQWTVTGAGCTVLSDKGSKKEIVNATFGKVTDFGINDVNNMGAAMAPAAMSTLITHFEDTHTTPDDYDLIVTGDLGKLGSEILLDLMEHKGYKLKDNYNDCGQMIYSNDQKVYQGGSGCGCSAVVLNSYIMQKIDEGVYKRVLFAATGALLSTLSSQQGNTIPGICHAVEIRKGD
ncbi:MAG: stage V sporulation protein AD [Clostridiales bacterium]|nr:stage V sporulation protein AD [Clostridiales bacterium]